MILRMADKELEQYRVDKYFDIDQWPADDAKIIDGGKEEGRKETATVLERLDALQEVLHAEGKQKVLIVLQGMDTSGKDGTLRHVFSVVDPQGLRVVTFKKPTEEELAHDYLWRVHRNVPGRGELVVFNRSHYEDVLVVRVDELVPKSVWSKRYDQINAFEKLLAETGTTIMKFYLHISRDEQRQRLQARIDDPEKRWKFHSGDLAVRAKWDAYMEAYRDALRKTSTKYAPWYVIPADRKWYRDYLIARITVDTLEGLEMKYPEVDVSGVTID